MLQPDGMILVDEICLNLYVTPTGSRFYESYTLLLLTELLIFPMCSVLDLRGAKNSSHRAQLFGP